jgi:hypothetical protein
MNLVGRRVNIELKDGYVYAAKTVLAEDEWSITIQFQNVPKIIPRSEIKSIQVTG